MPLRDHFHPPVSDRHSWDEVHGGWPMMIVRDLFNILPPGYMAKPNVHLGAMFEIDVSAFENDIFPEGAARDVLLDAQGVALAPEPTLTLESELAEFDEYEVRIYDSKLGRRLVAAIEIVSPSNKDRPRSREAFVSKVLALLREDVCVCVVDLVTVPQTSLYSILLESLGKSDSRDEIVQTNTYAFTLRSRPETKRPSLLDVWVYPMIVGQPLPTLPIWLSPTDRVLLPLETSYQETCRLLHID